MLIAKKTVEIKSELITIEATVNQVGSSEYVASFDGISIFTQQRFDTLADAMVAYDNAEAIYLEAFGGDDA